MNDKQSAELNMFQSVKEVLAGNKSKYETISVFSKAVTDFDGNIKAIRKLAKDRKDVIVPAATGEKQSVENKMIDQALKVARVTNVYAFDTENQQLQMQTDIFKSKFYRLHGNQKLALAKSIYGAARPLADALIDYGLITEELDDLENLVIEYNDVIVKPRGTINERKGMTADMALLFADTKSLLNDRMDKMMRLFKNDNTNFYEAYFYARNVINTAYRKKKPTKEEVIITSEDIN